MKRIGVIAFSLAAVLLAGGCATGASDPATYVSDRSATLNAHGSAGGEVTEYFFQCCSADRTFESGWLRPRGTL